MADYPKYEKEGPKKNDIPASMADFFDKKDTEPKAAEVKEPKRQQVKTAAKAILISFGIAAAIFGTRITQGIKQAFANRAASKPERDRIKAEKKQALFEKEQAKEAKQKADKEKRDAKFEAIREKQAKKNPKQKAQREFEKRTGLRSFPDKATIDKKQAKEAEKQKEKDAIKKAHNERGLVTLPQALIISLSFVKNKAITYVPRAILLTTAACILYPVYAQYGHPLTKAEAVGRKVKSYTVTAVSRLSTAANKFYYDYTAHESPVLSGQDIEIKKAQDKMAAQRAPKAAQIAQSATINKFENMAGVKTGKLNTSMRAIVYNCDLNKEGLASYTQLTAGSDLFITGEQNIGSDKYYTAVIVPLVKDKNLVMDDTHYACSTTIESRYVNVNDTKPIDVVKIKPTNYKIKNDLN